jgi:hypothetical protein
MFPVINHIARWCLCFAACIGTATAQPLLSSMQLVQDQRVYRDMKQSNLFYYMPFDYKLVTGIDGRPDFTLMQMRYTGTRATGDAGSAKYNNLLQFRVALDQQQQKKVTDLKAALKKMVPGSELRSLPVRKFSSVLVFAGTTDTAFHDSLHIIKTNYAEATDESAAVNNSYWSERVVTLRLNNFDAQMVESALRNRQSVMSFSYAIYTVFSEADAEDVTVYGNSGMRKEIKDFFENEVKNQTDSALRVTMIRADVISLAVNVNDWPGVIQKVDINEKVPARYPLFDVYCYDFNNALRPDLYSKKIEIKATSVNGSDVVAVFSFRQSQPELYAKSIRFPYAVRFDKPFYYRVTEVSADGEAMATEWKQKKEWSELLDITSPPDKVVVKTVPEEDE